MGKGATSALILTCLLTSAAWADDRQPAAKPDKKICRREEVIGSVIPARICLTKAEWRRQYELAQDETREMHTRAMPGD